MLTRVALLAFCLCVLSPRCQSEIAAADPLRIVTLGDSITKGVRSGVTAEETFAGELQRQLRAGGHTDAEVVNVGVGGETAGQGLKRLEKDVVAKKPAIVTIMYGHNDSYVDAGKTEVRIPIPRFRADLSQLVQRLRESGITPILMTPPAYAEKSDPNGIGEHCNVKLAQYAEVTRQVAETLQVPLVDHYAAWAEVSKSGTDLNEWTTDGYHPNPKGHGEMAGRMLPVVISDKGALYPWEDSVDWFEHPGTGIKASRRFNEIVFTGLKPETREIRFPRLNNVVISCQLRSLVKLVNGHLNLTQTPQEWRIEIPEERIRWYIEAEVSQQDEVILQVDGMPRIAKSPAVSRPGSDRVITLSACDAVVHGEKLQFEPLTHKNTVGYWVNPSDYAEWSYALDTPGEFEVEILQGCGGHAGSDVELGFSEGTVPFVVEETGHFQNFVWRKIGRVALKELGVQVMSLKCNKLAKGAVMDMRQVRLVPTALATNDPRDMRDVPTDLVPPGCTNEAIGPGRRCHLRASKIKSHNAYHTLYLPTNHNMTQKWPILVEWTGNGYFRSDRGDVSTGSPTTGELAYGLSGGYGAICLSLPFLRGDGEFVATQWWGEAPTYDSTATVKYMKTAIAETCEKYHGDPSRVIFVGFSRGAIAVNAVGLSTEEAAGLWKAAVCFSHYDGVGNWPFPKSDAASAIERLQRLGTKPQFIISESPSQGPALADQAREFIEKSSVKGDFTFATTGFLNHSDQWALRPSPARTQLREWLQRQMAP